MANKLSNKTDKIKTPAPVLPAPKQSKPTPALYFHPGESTEPATFQRLKALNLGSMNDQLYLVVKSFGGDAYSAVRIVKHLRTKFKTIIGVVPDYAYSAATLMLLGTNKILISPEGNLGPKTYRT